MSLFDPRVLVGLLIAFSITFVFGHRHGYQAKEQEDEIVIAQKNQEMADNKEKADNELAKANKKLSEKGIALSNAIRNGSQRLYVPVASSGCSASTTGDTETRAELDKSVAEALIKITLDGDKSIVYLNSCIDRYNSVRATSGKR